LQVRVNAPGIAVLKQLERFFRGTGGLLLLRRFSTEDPQNCQVILDLLERIEDSLPITGDSGVHILRGLIRSRPASPRVEKPVAVIPFPKPGPTLALVAGAHGIEYASIIALEKLIQELNPADISGTASSSHW